VSYEISSRQISKKVIFLCSMCVFLCFFLVLLGKMRFWMVFLLFSLLFAHLCGFYTPPFITGPSGTHHEYTFYIVYFIKWSKSCLHAPFDFHASFAVWFHFDFFSTCFVTFGSPCCKQVSVHSILTTASVSVCIISSTTFPWHHTWVGSHS